MLLLPWELSVPGNHNNNAKVPRPSGQSAGRRLVLSVISPSVQTHGAAQTQHVVTNLPQKRQPNDVQSVLDLSTTPADRVYIVVALAIEAQNVFPADPNPVQNVTRQWVPTRANARSARTYSHSPQGKQPSVARPARAPSIATHAPACIAARQFHRKRKILLHLEL